MTVESVIALQRAFNAHFMLCWNDPVPERKSVLLWVKNFKSYLEYLEMYRILYDQLSWSFCQPLKT